MPIPDPKLDATYEAARAAYLAKHEQRRQTAEAIAEHESLAETLGIEAAGEQPDWEAVEENERDLRALRRDLQLLDSEIEAARIALQEAWTPAQEAGIVEAEAYMQATREGISTLILELLAAIEAGESDLQALTSACSTEPQFVGTILPKLPPSLPGAFLRDHIFNRAMLRQWAEKVS